MALLFIPPRSGTMAGNHCCYRRGTLCTDSECGGTVDMVSPRDWTTYLQHTMEDVVPAVFCCKGPVASRNCDAYQQKRPIDDGSKSPPPPPIPGNQYTVNDMTMSYYQSMCLQACIYTVHVFSLFIHTHASMPLLVTSVYMYICIYLVFLHTACVYWTCNEQSSCKQLCCI